MSPKSYPYFLDELFDLLSQRKKYICYRYLISKMKTRNNMQCLLLKKNIYILFPSKYQVNILNVIYTYINCKLY